MVISQFWIDTDKDYENSRSEHACMSVYLYAVLSCVGRGLYDQLITRPKKSHHVFNKIKKAKTGGQGTAWAVKVLQAMDHEN
jgi:hypothetical protein